MMLMDSISIIIIRAGVEPEEEEEEEASMYLRRLTRELAVQLCWQLCERKRKKMKQGCVGLAQVIWIIEMLWARQRQFCAKGGNGEEQN